MSAPASAVPVSLNHHKQEAKQLLASFVSGDPSALERVASARPKLAEKDPFILADAQSVIAREVGFDSWRKLKDQLEAEDPKLAILRSLNAHHAQLMGEHLAKRLNAGITCSLQSVRESTFGAYLETGPPEVALYIFDLEPMGGPAALDYSSDLAYGIIYRDAKPSDGRPDEPATLTGPERGELTPTVRRHLADLEAAWGPGLHVRVNNAEYMDGTLDPRMLEADTPVSIATMSVSGSLTGTIRVCYPLSLIWPALDPEIAKGLSENRTREIIATRQVINVILPPGVNPIRGMSFVPAGPFLMGDHTPGSWAEEPARKVTLGSYWIDTYPVTNADYRRFVDETGRQVPPHWTSGTYQVDQIDHPVANVSWDDAQAYASWAGKRLPTEAEWEKASRGTDGQLYPWGNTFWKDLCNSSNDYGGTTSVEQFAGGASPYGIVDMVGNVFEWCSDWHEEGYASSGDTDPKGPEAGEVRSMRGSFHGAFGKYLRCAYRGWAPPENKQDTIGFRCAKDVS